MEQESEERTQSGVQVEGGLLSLNDGNFLLFSFRMVSTVIIYKVVKVHADVATIMP